jgi:hypothetical protein
MGILPTKKIIVRATKIEKQMIMAVKTGRPNFFNFTLNSVYIGLGVVSRILITLKSGRGGNKNLFYWSNALLIRTGCFVC